jgi:plastocyanin
VVGRGEVLSAGANRPAQVQMVFVFAAASYAGAEVILNRNVSRRVQFAIYISRSQLLSFFTSHIVCLCPCGWLSALTPASSHLFQQSIHGNKFFTRQVCIVEREVFAMLTKRNFLLALTLILAGVVLAVSQQPAAGTNEIVIQNFAFEPATLTVKVGTKVTWVNRDDEPHTATATDKRFNSKTLENGDRFTTEFNQPGIYKYYCALHPKMTGQVIVK